MLQEDCRQSEVERGSRSNLLLTVAICTWNRAATLDRTLRQFETLADAIHVPWELVVVDNNSSDATQQVLEKYRTRLPLRTAFEPTPGLSHARNCAIDVAQGELIVWTDDDVRISPQWFQAYAKAAAGKKSAVFFGGPIAPCFDVDPPHWLARAMSVVETVYGKIDLGPEEHYFQDALPFGANFAIRKEIQQRYRFDATLGRCGSQLLAGEETALMQELLRAGHRGMWLPEARIEHCIPAEQMTIDYLSRRFVASGKTARIMNIGKRRGWWHMCGKIAQYEALWRVWLALNQPERYLHYRLQSSHLRGQLSVS